MLSSGKNIAVYTLIALFLALGIFISKWNINTYKEKIMIEKTNSLLLQLETAAKAIEQMFVEHKDVLKVLAANKQVIEILTDKKEYNACARYCFIENEFLQHINDIDELMLINSKGIKFHFYNNNKDLDKNHTARTDLSKNIYVKQVLNNSLSAVSDIYINQDNKKIISVLEPVIYNNKTIGIVAFNYYINNMFNKLIKPLNNKQQAAAFIDNNKRFVNHSIHSFIGQEVYQTYSISFKGLSAKNKSYAQETIKKILGHEKGSAIIPFINEKNDKKEQLVVYCPVNISNKVYAITLSSDIDVLLKPARGYTIKIYVAFCSLIILFLAISYFLINSYKEQNILETETEYLRELSKKNVELKYQKIEFESLYKEHKSLNEELEVKNKNIKGSEERLKMLSNLTFEGILIHDNGIVIDGNKSFLKMFEFTKEEILGKNIIEKIIPEKYRPFMHKKMESEYSEPFHLEMIKKNGEIFPVEIEAQKIFYENKPARVTAIRDISNIQKAEADLLKSNQKLALHIEQTPLGVIEWDLEFKVVSWNKAAENIFAYSYKEAKGRHTRFIIPKKYHQHVDGVWNNLVNNKGGSRNTNENITRKGETIICEWYNTPLVNPNGKIIGVASLVQDVTIQKNTEFALVNKNIELKEAEEKLQAYNEKLLTTNQALKNNMDELTKAKEKAESSDKLKSAFLANMSHEIRTPMNGIFGFIQLLRITGHDNNKRDNFMNIIEKSGMQLLSIINDIVDISKLEAGLIEIRNTEINLNHLFSNLYSTFNISAKEKGLSLSLKQILNNQNCIILSDQARLKQILSNLLNNALKFTHKGNIEFGYKIKGLHIEFYVKDTGIGINSADQEVIFDRFRQLELTTSRQYGGTGLGLAITKALVKKLGGYIHLTSTPEKGSTFYFTMAYTPAPDIGTKAEPAKEDSSPQINWRNKTILIAEDETSNYIYLEEVLSETNVNIIRACNGKEACEICETNNIDLILMDIKMPIMDGKEAAKKIKQIHPQMPIIAQTAFAMEGDKNEILSSGCDDYITKPITMENLLEKINKFLTN